MKHFCASLWYNHQHKKNCICHVKFQTKTILKRWTRWKWYELSTRVRKQKHRSFVYYLSLVDFCLKKSLFQVHVWFHYNELCDCNAHSAYPIDFNNNADDVREKTFRYWPNLFQRHVVLFLVKPTVMKTTTAPMQ